MTMPTTDDDRPLACREGRHDLRRDVLLEDHALRVIEYCTRKGCGYTASLGGISRRHADPLCPRLQRA